MQRRPCVRPGREKNKHIPKGVSPSDFLWFDKFTFAKRKKKKKKIIRELDELGDDEREEFGFRKGA